MKKLLLAACLTNLLLGAARAEESAPAIELKNKSSFDATEARDPFWPIGWKRPGPKTSTSGPDLSPASFSLTSVTTDAGARFVILNGKIMQEGQQFSLQSGSQNYQIQIKSIEDGRVILACRDQEVIVPLRRK